MRFLVDAQLPPALARWLADKGFVAEHVFDLGLERSSGGEIWQLANQVDAVIVTKDEDFVRLAVTRSTAPQVLWLRMGNSTKRVLLAWLDRAWPSITDALRAGESVVEIALRHDDLSG